VFVTLQMKNRAKRKRTVKSSGKQDDSHSTDQVPMPVVKEEIPAEVSVAAEIRTAGNRSDKQKQSVTKRRRASSTGDSGSVQRQVDSDTVHDKLPPRKRKRAVVSSQNDEALQQDEHKCHSVNSRRPVEKKQHPTRTRKSSSDVQKKNVGKEQSETAVVSKTKKSSKVKSELPSVSPVKAVDKISIKTEKPETLASPQHSCRKFIGAHMSISGTVYQLLVTSYRILHFLWHCIACMCIFHYARTGWILLLLLTRGRQ